MNQNTTIKKFSAKRILLAVFLCFAALMLFVTINAFLFKHISHHERFYGAVSWIYTLAMSLVIALISKKCNGNSVMFSVSVSLLFSLITIAFGCLFASETFKFFSLLFRLLLLVALSVSITVMMNYNATKITKKRNLKRQKLSKR